MFLGRPDPLVRGMHRYGSGSGSGYFYHQAKIVRKTLIPAIFVTSFRLFIFDKFIPYLEYKELNLILWIPIQVHNTAHLGQVFSQIIFNEKKVGT
jgi:hypothetical protein